jgi:GTP-binding protein
MSENKVRQRPQPAFICSAASAKDFPELTGEEYAVLGRSNVGKSSFISHVLERHGLARVSRKPGKTTLANFFRIDAAMIWVDLPGYGYAKTSGSEKLRWSRLIRSYCEQRRNLAGILWLIDIRHPGVRADCEAREWIGQLQVPIFTVLTKSDKISRQQAARLSRKTATALHLENTPLQYSTLQHASRERFWNAFEAWRKNEE